jgi:hypothetical protein
MWTSKLLISLMFTTNLWKVKNSVAFSRNMEQNSLCSDDQQQELNAMNLATRNRPHPDDFFGGMEEEFDAEQAAPNAEPVLYKEDCKKCKGTGRYTGYGNCYRPGVCSLCQGAGYRLFKTSKEQRAKARQTASARKEKQADDKLAAFEAEHPDVAAWWKNSTFPFAVSLRESVRKFGGLTAGQLNAARKCAVKFADAKKAREGAEAVPKPSVDASFITNAFERAMAKGVRKPHLRLVGDDSRLDFSRAADNGRNPGAIYVKSISDEGKYLGKISGGVFSKARDCSESEERAVIAACADPEQAAIAFGRRFGACSVCGRELTNGESIDIGIGPICREKFFG